MGARARGDFQTPAELASAVARLVIGAERPRAILEPTCGRGSLLLAALARAPRATAIGVELDSAHLAACRALVGDRARLIERDFFTVDWPALIASLPDPLLVIGNPPWVTSATLGALGADNAPPRSTAWLDADASGLAAITGASNFDISEWMLWHLWPQLSARRATMAMLIKTAVARKLLARAWRSEFDRFSAELHRIDAHASFGAAVDACLLVCRFGAAATSSCTVYDSLGGTRIGAVGVVDDELVSDVAGYTRYRHLLTTTQAEPRWRSGVKHDCAAIVELRRADGGLINGLGEVVDVESSVLFPYLKSAALHRGVAPPHMLLLPQRTPGEDPARLATAAPRAWAYLQRHRARFDARKSSIYRGRAPFSVFGVGDYSFAPWKVAVSGFYKELQFRVIGPDDGAPVLLDDTSYGYACESRAHARRVLGVLHSEPVQTLLRSMVFWDAKRPITARLLRRLDLTGAARAPDEAHPESARRVVRRATP